MTRRASLLLATVRSIGTAGAIVVYLTATAIDVVGAAWPLEPMAAQAGEPGAQALVNFHKRVDEYLALHKRVEDNMPRLPTRATPQQIDAAQRQLSQGIATARAGAKAGDVFGRDAGAHLRQALERAFSGADGKQLRASILDENPVGAQVRVNGPYPDAIPLSTMPPQVLEVLPKLAEELEFRFVGERLILFDNHAHLIVDYLDRALPRV